MEPVVRDRLPLSVGRSVGRSFVSAIIHLETLIATTTERQRLSYSSCYSSSTNNDMIQELKYSH